MFAYAPLLEKDGLITPLPMFTVKDIAWSNKRETTKGTFAPTFNEHGDPLPQPMTVELSGPVFASNQAGYWAERTRIFNLFNRSPQWLHLNNRKLLLGSLTDSTLNIEDVLTGRVDSFTFTFNLLKSFWHDIEETVVILTLPSDSRAVEITAPIISPGNANNYPTISIAADNINRMSVSLGGRSLFWSWDSTLRSESTYSGEFIIDNYKGTFTRTNEDGIFIDARRELFLTSQFMHISPGDNEVVIKAAGQNIEGGDIIITYQNAYY